MGWTYWHGEVMRQACRAGVLYLCPREDELRQLWEDGCSPEWVIEHRCTTESQRKRYHTGVVR